MLLYYNMPLRILFSLVRYSHYSVGLLLFVKLILPKQNQPQSVLEVGKKTTGLALLMGVHVFFCEERQLRMICDAEQLVSSILFQGRGSF